MSVSKLPKWFNGTRYNDGDKVTNPFSGESFTLSADELSMYDFIMGAQMMFEHGMNVDSKISNDFDKGLTWFRVNNAKAYMVLLD